MSAAVISCRRRQEHGPTSSIASLASREGAVDATQDVSLNFFLKGGPLAQVVALLSRPFVAVRSYRRYLAGGAT